MNKNIIGREEELEVLSIVYKSRQAEFLSVYGRRRVGKTYLIRTYFEHMKKSTFFYVTGVNEGSMAIQLANFMEELGRAFLYPGIQLESPKNWRNAFKILTDNVSLVDKSKKIILFFDEFPWMVTKNSKLLQTLEYYWNHHWSRDNRVKLIICGSSAGWILKNIVNNRGGLYNRVTRSLCLEPFTLSQTKKYLTYLNIKLNHQQIVQLYMILGGIPYYLSKIEKGLSATEVIETLSHKKNSFLLTEFDNLYATLFGSTGGHIVIASELARHVGGLDQTALMHYIPTLSSGGRIKEWLSDLEHAGFIMKIRPFLSTKKSLFYKMMDEYSLFYFGWIESLLHSLSGGIQKGYWEKIQNTPAWFNWRGYAFEALCYKHIAQISKALQLNAAAIPYVWRYVAKKSDQQGAQIDLLFDRDDDCITICEIKYTDQPFVIDKAYAEVLKRKIAVFTEKTKTTKHIFLVMICASGLKKTMYSEEMVDKVVVLDDLFK